MKKILYSLLIISLLLFSSGCNKENSQKGPEEEDINMGSGKITIKGKDGNEMIINSQELPEDFPGDIPIYPSSTVCYSAKVEEKNETTISLEASDTVDEIENFYKKELEKKGWTIEQVFTTDKSSMFTGKKKNRKINIAVTSGKKNHIAISVYLEE